MRGPIDPKDPILRYLTAIDISPLWAAPPVAHEDLHRLAARVQTHTEFLNGGKDTRQVGRRR